MPPCFKRAGVAILLLCSAPATASDFTGYGALTTDYVRRGVTQSDGEPAVQLGIDLAFTNGIFVGAWSSTVDIDSGPSRHRDKEVNYYVGYAFDVANDWRLSGNVVAYRYPGQTGDIDYGYEEYSVGVNFKDRIWLEYSYSPDLHDSGLSSGNVDLYGEWPVNSTWAIGGGGGYYDTSKLSGNGYRYWQLGVTGAFKYVDVDIRLHDTDRWVPVISAPDRASGRVALTIRIPF